uniref:Thioredoxin domain-containing protein n=1 Tax=Onchocerca volvulus TaxID=6282 RepID=A0A8R1XXC0_ONCVO
MILRYRDVSRTTWNAIFSFLLAEESDSGTSRRIPVLVLVLVETIAQNKSVLWQNFIAEHSFGCVFVLKFCINSLKMFFSWYCRRALLDLLLAVLKKAAVSSMIEKGIEAIMIVASEEKKHLSIFLLHECARYSRLRALQTVSWICKNRYDSADNFIHEIFLIMEILETMKNRFFGLSLAHQEKTRLSQLLLLIHDFASEEMLKKLELFCIECLKKPVQQPSVRLIMSWILVRLYCNNEDAFQKFTGIEEEVRFCHFKIFPYAMTSNLLKRLIQLFIKLPFTVSFARCFTLFHPWCTAQNFAVRCTSLATLRLLWNIAGNKLRDQFSHLCSVIKVGVEKAGNTKRTIDKLCNDFYFTYLDESVNYFLKVSNFNSFFRKKIGLTQEDVITADLLKNISVEDFACIRCNSDDLSQYSSFIFGHLRFILILLLFASDTLIIQRKFNAVSVNRACLKDVSLIVIASLLEKAANLGGICRTCEVLGVGKLIVADLSRVRSGFFGAKYVDLEQSRLEELPDLLFSYRDSGYVIIGAEQMTNSTPLHKICLPSKMVLLLGYVDKAVEILQVGLTRSLNVHVTGALFIYRFFQSSLRRKCRSDDTRINMNLIIRLFTSVRLLVILSLLLNVVSERNYIVTINDQKDYKKVLRVHKNVLILFSNSSMDKNNQLKKVIKTTMEAAKQAMGQGTVAQINCNHGELRKLCKKLKITPKPYILKHYQNGEFHKDYDRRMIAKSMYRFLLDPTGDIPWDEDSTAVNVIHLDDSNALRKIISGEKPVLIMFYAPWCGFCKRLKPEFSAAADELKGKIVLAGMDLTHHGNEIIAKQFNIDGYPTLEYFEGGMHKFRYKGQNSKSGIIEWLKNPVEQTTSPSLEEEEISWTGPTNEVVLLNDGIFDEFIMQYRSVLVFLYAPCMFISIYNYHCKMVKPEFVRAAERLKTDGIDGVLAAIDATTNKKIAERYKVDGYPTFAYFKNGKFAWKISGRKEHDFYSFMKNPVEPPPPELSWSKQSGGAHVLHLTAENFKAEVRKKKHALIIFYAPWCGYCKKAKPKFFEASKVLAADARIVLGAVDCTVERSLCQEYKIQGFPTIIYLSYGKNRIDYAGEHETTSFISFVESGGRVSKPQSSISEFGLGNVVIVLDENNFDRIISSGNVFVMFFSPWCGHCKAVKSAFREAAEQSHFGKFAVVDCTTWNDLCERQSVKEYPTFQIFVNGVQHDYSGNRTSSDFTTAFMKVVALTKIDL